jgi:lipopolysaccharide/colanic/teichoic acid biosynthesis glycosyltransferase
MYKHLKRLIDAILSTLLIVIFLPVWFIVPFLIIIYMGFPVFFKQDRVGLGNRVFEIYKFRTMIKRTSINYLDVQRITKLGRILRITRIDEFPQLFNILKGNMSFIGPRPLLPDYLPFYSQIELRRHEVRPGLSGLSLLCGSYPDWEIQFAYDVQYVDNLSFVLDWTLFIKTIKKVFTPSKKLITGDAGRERFDIYRMTHN